MNLGELIQEKWSYNPTSEEVEHDGYRDLRLLQSDLDLDDLEMEAIAQFTQPEVIRRVLREMK